MVYILPYPTVSSFLILLIFLFDSCIDWFLQTCSFCIVFYLFTWLISVVHLSRLGSSCCSQTLLSVTLSLMCSHGEHYSDVITQVRRNIKYFYARSRSHTHCCFSTYVHLRSVRHQGPYHLLLLVYLIPLMFPHHYLYHFPTPLM